MDFVIAIVKLGVHLVVSRDIEHDVFHPEMILIVEQTTMNDSRIQDAAFEDEELGVVHVTELLRGHRENKRFDEMTQTQDVDLKKYNEHKIRDLMR